MWALPIYFSFVVVLVAAVIFLSYWWGKNNAGQEARIRTFAAVAMGACVFSFIAPDRDTRVAGQVVPGIGFLGTDVILHGRAHSHRLATAASLWATTSIAEIIGHLHIRKGVALVVNGRRPQSI